MTTPTAPRALYTEKLEQAAQALQLLSLHPDGLSIDDLAEMLGLDTYDTRQNLASYHESQFMDDDGAVSPLLLADQVPPQDWDGQTRDDWLWDHEAADLQSAVWVALDRDLSGSDVFGVMLDVAQIVDLLTCADHLLAQEPDNEPLRTAVAALRLKWVPGMTSASQTFPSSPVLPTIRRAIVEHRQLKFVYSREWEPGTSVRIVDPYELKQTHLGYELDAGPVADNGRIRTFLVRNMSEVAVLDEHFEEPADKARLIAANRQTIRVRITVPQESRRAYEALAQDLDVRGGAPDDDSPMDYVVTLQQPFEERLAMFMFRAGPGARVVEDISLMNRADSARYAQAAPDAARRLLAHHGLVDPPE